jgi:hypothetical protein
VRTRASDTQTSRVHAAAFSPHRMPTRSLATNHGAHTFGQCEPADPARICPQQWADIVRPHIGRGSLRRGPSANHIGARGNSSDAAIHTIRIPNDRWHRLLDATVECAYKTQNGLCKTTSSRPKDQHGCSCAYVCCIPAAAIAIAIASHCRRSSADVPAHRNGPDSETPGQENQVRDTLQSPAFALGTG